MSVLLPSTLALLGKVRELSPLFANLDVAAHYEAAHTRGSLKLLPFAAGGHVVVDTTAPLGRGTLAGPMPLEQAHAELVRLAAELGAT
ncbi:MAG TPA: hypothetical protein VET26_12380 [Candidatus Sulfotelmatobacter sp.]|nr:hypothetical protein [Candidatus Sulfotelmatobacter sp.]